MTLQNPVLLGIVGGAHGIRGEVRIKSFTADPVDIKAYGPLFDISGNRFTIKTARLQKSVVVASIAEVRDRNEAERLNGRELFVDRSVLPDDEEDAFYQNDLVGFAVVTMTGDAVGTLVAFHDFGAGEVVEIKPPRGPTVMIPFSEAAVPEIDVERRVMIVESFAAGLVETPDDASDAGNETDGKPAKSGDGDGR